MVCSMSNVFARALLQDEAENVINGLAGCFLVDYSYSETKALKEGYVLDPRVYDVNKDKSVKEWIYPESIGPGHIRLQHILFAADLRGELSKDSLLKHQAEDWEYEPEYVYDFVGPNHWKAKDTRQASKGLWVRKITNLDDGLRYQCLAGWNLTNAFAEWSCSNFAPIPGRETRDMKRRDYNTMDRTTRIISYGRNWLERQNNVKTIFTDGKKQPLAEEEGKNWYVKLPDSECKPAKKWAQERKHFWRVMRETWEDILDGQGDFIEKAMQPPRFTKIWALEGEYLPKLPNARAEEELKGKVHAIIDAYRE